MIKKTATFTKFYTILQNIKHNNELNLVKLASFDITEQDKIGISKAIDMRHFLNEIRGTNDIECYQRATPQSEINLKAMIGEYMFSRLLQSLIRNETTINKRRLDFTVKPPAIAEMILDTTRQDFLIIDHKDPEQNLNFDIKGQFLTNGFPYVCVNISSFEKMKSKNNFFVVALSDGNQTDIETNNKITFYLVKTEFYEQNATKVLESTSARFTPYLKLHLDNFKDL